MLLDLTTAFDTTDHTIRLIVLYVIKIHDRAFAVLKSHSRDHFQKVKIKRELSNAVALQYGVHMALFWVQCCLQNM